MKEVKKKKVMLTPEQLDANYNKYMIGKELVKNGKELFEKTLKKSVKKK